MLQITILMDGYHKRSDLSQTLCKLIGQKIIYSPFILCYLILFLTLAAEIKSDTMEIHLITVQLPLLRHTPHRHQADLIIIAAILQVHTPHGVLVASHLIRRMEVRMD